MTAPLSHGQKALWFLHRVAPESAAYTIAGSGRIVGPVDAARLRRAFAAVVERHASLRTSFPVEGGAPVQRVEDAGPDVFEEVDGSGWGADEVPQRVADLSFRPFDLERAPAVRVLFVRGAPGGPVLAVSLHHAVGDLWSLALLLREAGEAYDDLAAGREPLGALSALPLTYRDFAAREAEVLAGEEGERLRRFWTGRLAGGVPALDLPADRQRPPVQSFEGAVVSRRLGGAGAPEAGPALRKALGALARGHKATLFSVLMAGFQALLGRYSGQDAFAVGTPTSGRVRSAGGSAAELAGLVGYFVNPLPLRADLAGGPSFGELVERVRDETAAALEHQGYPLPLLAEALDPGGGRGRPSLFNTMLVLQKSPIPGMRELPAFALGRAGTPLRLGSLDLESIGLPQRGSQFDLTLFVTEEGGALVASLEYDTALFDAATAERMLGHLDTLLQAAAGEPERPLAELPILTAGERRRLLGERASGGAAPAEVARVDPPVGGVLHELVLEQAARTPDAEALVVGERRWSYRELVDRAGAVADHLRELGAGPEAPVGVFLRRGPDLVPALLGVLRAGAAYVPMDPAYPPERIALMVADSAMPLVLTEAALSDRLGGVALGSARVVTIEESVAAGGAAPAPGAPPPVAPPPVAPDHLAYVIYTSGSTGRPKGVAITHRNATAMVRWAGSAFGAAELATVLGSTSVCFDLSVFEIFVPLAHGGRLVLADDALALPGLPAARAVTLVNTVPSAMTRLAEAGGLPPSLLTVNLAGEPLRGSLVEALHAAGVRRVVNLYGPSEDTTYSTIAECLPAEGREPTIGRVVTGGRGYVVDRGLHPLPEGVPGELLLGGGGVARGYLGRPALTAERFVPDPFAGVEAGGPAGGRLYRTGDRVRYLADGRLEFLGRLDHQVKVRGFRIELGEVDLALRAHPAVAEAVTVARGEGADRSLVAYLVAAPGSGGPLPPAGELRSFLGARLPDYMVPSVFVALEALPLTPNGKVDRAALPEPDAGRPELSDEYVAPETEVEVILAELWSRVLGVERIGIHDSFFELGGHSLKATEVLLSVRELFGVEVPVHSLFERPTIAGLSVAIADQLLAGAEDGEVAALLAGLESAP